MRPGGNAAHLLVWHLSPMLVVILAAGVFGRQLLGGR